MQKSNIIFKSVRYLTLAAMLTAVSVVIGIICKNFLDFGGVFRITFENLPIILAGIVMGPAVGGMVGAASDLVSYLLSSQVYPPNLIVTAGAAAVGVVSGICAKYAVKKRGTKQVIVSAAAAHLVGSMIIKTIGLYYLTFQSVVVLWRIPIYLVIAPVEIVILCLIFKQKNIRKLFEKI